MPHVGKGKLFNSEAEKPNAFLQAILREDAKEVEKFIENGQQISDFLYMQVTNNDDLKILKFLLSIQPHKRTDAIKLSVYQGAAQCLTYFTPTESKSALEELSKLKPRKNQEEISKILNEAITSKVESVEIPTSPISPLIKC
jgi:hypothetical protein